MTGLASGRWPLETRLAALALVLGVVAVFGRPTSGGTVTLNVRELAAIVEGEVDHVEVDELADWIIQGRTDYRLLDVRDAAAYAEYHIPTAESVRLSELAGYPLFRNEKIVLYSDGGTHSAQAWFLLKASRYPGVYILLYGLEEWKNRILFPALSSDADPEAVREFQRASEVSRFFGGTPQAGTPTETRPAVTMPEAPAPSQAPAASRKKKRKEGC